LATNSKTNGANARTVKLSRPLWLWKNRQAAGTACPRFSFGSESKPIVHPFEPSTPVLHLTVPAGPDISYWRRILIHEQFRPCHSRPRVSFQYLVMWVFAAFLRRLSYHSLNGPPSFLGTTGAGAVMRRNSANVRKRCLIDDRAGPDERNIK
jgi:hypothetical protein